MTNELEPLLTVEDLCVKLRVKKRYVYKLTQEGRIPYVKIGKYLRFRPSEIREWLRTYSAKESNHE